MRSNNKEIWTDKINDFLRAKLVVTNHFWDLSDELTKGGDIFHIPQVTEMTANSKTVATAVTLNANTDTNIDLTVTTWYECSFAIEDRESRLVLASYNAQEIYARNAAYTVAAVLEDALIALFDNFSQTAGTSAAAMVDSDIRSAIQQLRVANVDLDDVALFLSPKAAWTDLMAIDRFVLANESGVNSATKGFIGKVYGIPVYESSRIGATTGSAQNAMAAKDALVMAHTPVRVQANYIPEYLSTLVTADIQYGVIENRDTSGVWIATAS
tara:strand:+ start:4406 stop:5215 length:810 start_codon:yes stop_codon:yes gene_type:complete